MSGHISSLDLVSFQRVLSPILVQDFPFGYSQTLWFRSSMPAYTGSLSMLHLRKSKHDRINTLTHLLPNAYYTDVYQSTCTTHSSPINKHTDSVISTLQSSQTDLFTGLKI